MSKRIDRMHDYLSKTSDRAVFVRSVLDQDEIEMFDVFSHELTILFPNLDWHLVYLHDQHLNENSAKPHYIHKDVYTFINAPTHPSDPDLAFNIINQLKDFKQLKTDPQEIKICKSTLDQGEYFLC